MPQLLATICQKREFIWWNSFVVMTPNGSFDVRPVLHIFVITLCVLNETLYVKIAKMVLGLSLHLKVYHENYFTKIVVSFSNDG